MQWAPVPVYHNPRPYAAKMAKPRTKQWVSEKKSAILRAGPLTMGDRRSVFVCKPEGDPGQFWAAVTHSASTFFGGLPGSLSLCALKYFIWLYLLKIGDKDSFKIFLSQTSREKPRISKKSVLQPQISKDRASETRTYI